MADERRPGGHRARLNGRKELAIRSLIVVLVLAGMTSAGFLLLRVARLRPSISIAGDLVVAFLLGSAATTLLAFWVSLVRPSAGLVVTLAVIAASLPVALALLAVHAARARPRPPATGDLRAVSIGLAVLLAPVLAYEGFLLLSTVIHSGPNWDGTFVWEIKARYFFALGGVPPSYFQDLSREWSHLDYPFLLPLTEALTYRALGAPSQGADMVVTAAFVLALLVLLHEMVRRTQGFGLAVAFTLLMMSVPAFWDNALQAFADLPLALFILAGAWFVYRWFDHGRRTSDLVLGGLLLAVAVWMKRDGVVVWATGASSIGVWTGWHSVRARSLVWRPLLAYVAPIIAILPWWLSVDRNGIQDHNFAFTLTWLLNHVDRVPALFQALAAELTLVPMWGVTWILIAAGILLRPPRSPGRAFLVAAVAAHVFAFTLAYTFSTWNPYTAHVNSSIMRVIFEVFPTGLLVLATGIDRDWMTVAWLWRRHPTLAQEQVSAGNVP